MLLPVCVCLRLGVAQTCTEAGYDFVRIYQDDARTQRWGLDKYSGDARSGNWPGQNGRHVCCVVYLFCLYLYLLSRERCGW